MPQHRTGLYTSWLDIANSYGDPTEDDLYEILTGCLNSPEWFKDPDSTDLYPFLALCQPYPHLRLLLEEAIQMWARGRKAAFWECVQQACTSNGQVRQTNGVVRMSGNELLAKEFPPLKWFAAGLLHEGNIIFAGKSKRGKSWVAFNIALDLARGREVFGHYEVPFPVKVAYCALEDGDRRMNRRIKQIVAEGDDLSNLEVVFRMPKLEEGGYEFLESLLQEGYRFIVIDVLAKVEGEGRNGAKGYLEVYQTLGDKLQELRNRYTFVLMTITHLRKAEAEDVAEGVMGSTAYVGLQDVVWVFSRKYGESFGHIEILDKDMAEKSIEIAFNDEEGVWTFVGEGDEYAASKEEHEILAFLREEPKPQSAKQIMVSLGIPSGKFQALRQRLKRMVGDEKLVRTDRGLYAAFGRSSWEQLDNDDVPF